MTETYGARRTYSVTVPANGSTRFTAGGESVTFLESNHASFEVISNDAGDRAEVAAGMEFRAPSGLTIPWLQIINPNGTALTVTFAVASGNFIDRRSQFSGVLNVQGDVGIASPSVLTDGADQTVAATSSASVAAANANRREIIVQNLGASDIRVGGASVGATRGLVVPGGGSVTLATTAAVYVYNTAGAGQDVAVVELEVP